MARRKQRLTINPRFNKYNVGDWLESAGFDAFPTNPEDLVWIWKRAIPEANKRLLRLEKYKKIEDLNKPTFAYSEALSYIRDVRGSNRYRRFNAKKIPDDYSQLEKEVKAALVFLNSQTSTPEGYEAWLENIRMSLSRSFNVSIFDKDDFRAFGDIMEIDETSKIINMLSSDQVIDLIVNAIHHDKDKKIEEIIFDFMKNTKDQSMTYLKAKFEEAFPLIKF